jgi:geranylgeranyl diphosphate synthase, type I
VVLSPVGSGAGVRPAAVEWVYDLVQDVLVDRLRAAVDRLPYTVRDVVRYHLGWGQPGGSPGKLIRPAVTLLAAAAVGATVESATEAAVAVELVHDALLLHDDVMAGALLRRHRETVWWRYGMPKAILAGDALLALAMDLLAPHPGAVSILSAAVREMAHGQCVDLAFEEREEVSVEECLLVAGARTAALLRCAGELGARYGGGRPEQVRALTRYGWHLGIAYQLTDDLLDIWGDPRLTGRTGLSDLRTGRMSLPVVAALHAHGPDSTELGALYRRPEPLEDEDLIRVAGLIERAGGYAWARTEARRQGAAARAALAAAEPVADASDALAALAATVAER